MATLREWKCRAHGEFSNKTGKCPHGCGRRFVVQEFRTAVAVHGGTAKSIDGHLQGLADTYKMSDIASTREGESVMQNLKRGQRMDAKSQWGAISVPHSPAGWTQQPGARPSDAVRFKSPYGPGVDLGRREAALPADARHDHRRR